MKAPEAKPHPGRATTDIHETVPPTLQLGERRAGPTRTLFRAPNDFWLGGSCGSRIGQGRIVYPFVKMYTKSITYRCTLLCSDKHCARPKWQVFQSLDLDDLGGLSSHLPWMLCS